MTSNEEVLWKEVFWEEVFFAGVTQRVTGSLMLA
jgi:hypothetical protein